MSDLVGNPEDRFSQNEAHMANFLVETIDSLAKIFVIFFVYRDDNDSLNSLVFTMRTHHENKSV